MLHTTTEGINEINDIIENIIKSRVDGVVIYNDKLMREELNTLTKYNVPIVIIGNKVSDSKISSVYVDIENAVYELVMKYLEGGKRDIAIIQDRKNGYSIDQMINGAKKAYATKGLEFNGYLEIPGQYRTSYDFMKDYLQDHKHDLIIANRDSQAIAVVNAAKENGIDIPKEMEIVCVIDTKYNSMMRPQISSFAIPSYDLGAVSMRVMTKMLQENTDDIDKEIELSYLFTPRQSTLWLTSSLVCGYNSSDRLGRERVALECWKRAFGGCEKAAGKGEYTSEPPMAKIGRGLRRYEEEHILTTRDMN